MAVQDELLAQAVSDVRRMNVRAEQALSTTDRDDIHLHTQEAIRFGEQARSHLEEALDSTEEEHLILRAEQALDAIEEALDQANMTLFASDAAMREHVEQMGVSVEQAMAYLNTAAQTESP